NTDIYGSGSYLWHEERKLDGNGKTRNKRMSDISAGISHTFLKDGKNPALIAFLESTVYEKSRNKASLIKKRGLCPFYNLRVNYEY
ncbi:TPA: hypothetical protein WND18_000001, partial [Neisseria gonorrhoeae]